MAGSIEANLAIYNKQINKYCPPTLPELMDSSVFTLDFADRKSVTIGLDVVNGFEVTVRIMTSTRCVSISVDFLRRIFAMLTNILSIITNPPVKSRERLFFKDDTISLTKMSYRGNNMLAIESSLGDRVMLNRQNLLTLQDTESCINETIVRKYAIVRPLVQGQLEQIAEYLKSDFYLEKTSTVQDITAFIAGIHNDLITSGMARTCGGIPVQSYVAQIKRFASIQLADLWSMKLNASEV